MLGAHGHQLMVEEPFRRCIGRDELTQANPKHFASLVEDRFDYGPEELLIASQVIHTIACHAYHCALNLGWWIKHVLIHGEETYHACIITLSMP